MGFATSGAFSDPSLLAHLATTAERCGFESLRSVEHVAIPVKDLTYPGSKDGQRAGGDDVAIPDPLIPLAYVAATTKTLKLVTAVPILLQRHPIYTAKEGATGDVISGVRTEAKKAGRNDVGMEFSCLGYAKVDNLKQLADLGVSRMVINPPGTNPEVITQRLEKFQEEVISRS